MKDLRSYQFENNDLWFALDDVLNSLELSDCDLDVLKADNPDYFRSLLDGTKLIHESGFYYLALFVSEVPEAKELLNWVNNEVVPSILTKGYYKKGEE